MQNALIKNVIAAHNDEERALLGARTTDEVSKGVEKGYLIKKFM